MLRLTIKVPGEAPVRVVLPVNAALVAASNATRIPGAVVEVEEAVAA